MSAHRAPWARRAINSAYVATLALRERNLPYWPPERIERLQRRRLRSIARHAYETVPFYGRAMRELGLGPSDFQDAADLARLPLIDGATVRKAPGEFASTAYDEGSRETFHTSGSASGARRTIYWDRRYVLRVLARAERERRILMRLTGERRVPAALRELVPKRGLGAALTRLMADIEDHQRISIFVADSYSRTMRRIWSEWALVPARAAHHHYLTPQLRYEEVIERMNAIRPLIVFSFGSYAEQFFRHVVDRGTRVSLPRVWMYTGDGMSDEARLLAERDLGCRVYSIYSAIEAQRLGIECERRAGFHLNTDQFAIRLIEDDGCPVEPGQTGEVVVSNLENRAMPLLNYRLGDRAALDPSPCSCGRSLPLLMRLEGRKWEVMRLADGRELSALVLENMFRAELRPTLSVQFSQSAPGALIWRIVPAGGADREALERAIVEKARELLGADTSVRLRFVEELGSTPQGKLPKVVPEDPHTHTSLRPGNGEASPRQRA
jgi:phenylacetate-CoA ligase